MISKFYIHALVILSIVMVGVSPACAFISGKSIIEICAADGTLQKVQVDTDLDPFAEPMPLSEHLEAMEQCSFCFSADKIKAHNIEAQSFSLVNLSHYLVVSNGTAIPLGARLTLYNPRGPPQLS